jgi:hypothetical protein
VIWALAGKGGHVWSAWFVLISAAGWKWITGSGVIWALAGKGGHVWSAWFVLIAAEVDD